MLDNVKIRLAHKEKKKSYGDAERDKNSSRYARRFVVGSPTPNGKPLTMEVDYYQANDRTVVDIVGIWRKWYLGKGTTRDLTYLELEECIGAIALKIGLAKEKVSKAKIIKIELGFNLRFREDMGGIINGFVYYKGFNPIYAFGRESIKFKGTGYSVAFYDKYSEIMNANEKAKREEELEIRRKGIYPKKRVSKKALSNKMNLRNFVLRFEVKVSDVSNAPPQIKGRVGSVSELIQNWNDLLDGLSEIFDKVSFAEYNLKVGLEFLEGKGMRELDLYKTHVVAIAVGGVDNYVGLLMKNLNSKHRSKNIKKELKALNSPPPELEEALAECKLKGDLVSKTKINRIKELKK